MTSTFIPSTETQLVQALQADQLSAFTALHESYAPALFGVLVRLVADPIIAEDLLQDTFLKVWINRHRYDAQQGRLFTWLLTIARHEALNELSRHKVQLKAKDYIHYQLAQRASTQAIEALTPRSLFELVSPTNRPIVELTCQGYTKEEIAHQLGLPVGTVKTRYRRAMQTLRDLFSQDIYHYYQESYF